MQVVLVSRTQSVDQESRPITRDYRLEINLGDNAQLPTAATQLPASEWAGASIADSSLKSDYVPVDYTYKPHALTGFSAFGSGLTNEFATFTAGREHFMSSASLREKCEDDIRSFAERSDHTEGFMISTPISNGFGGLTSSLLESLRDEFSKSKIFTTAMMENSDSWKRADTERSINQRLMNEALSMTSLEELSSMLLPIQAPTAWNDGTPWARYLRDDLPKLDSYTTILTAHLQSANNELCGADGLNSIINQLNWRGDNKIVHLSGASPLLPPEMLSSSEEGLAKLKESIKDFSILPVIPEQKVTARSLDPRQDNVFAQHSIVRGYEGNELERFGPILEASTPHREPLSIWLCLPDPYPIQSTASPIFQDLLPSGRPIHLHPQRTFDPLAPAGLYSLPPGISFPPTTPTPSSFAQPRSIPLLTTLSTSPATRHFLAHLSTEVKELLRVRSSALVEFENGEYGLGREGVMECIERLETLRDCYGISGGDVISSEGSERGQDDDEDWGIE